MSEHQDAWVAVAKACREDPEYRARMEADPKAALAEAGMDVGDGEVRVVVDTDEVRHMVMPLDPNAEMTEPTARGRRRRHVSCSGPPALHGELPRCASPTFPVVLIINGACFRFALPCVRRRPRRRTQGREPLGSGATLQSKNFWRAREAALAARAGAGTVHDVAVNAIAGAVAPAQRSMSVVPADAPLEVDANPLDKDAGFVRPGQRAAAKIESFPFARYGLVPGEATRVSADAVDDAVEVATGKRRAIDFFLSPLRRYTDEALRER